MLISVEKLQESDLKKDDNGKFAINDGKIYPRDGVFAFVGGIDGLTIAFVANNRTYCEAITIPVKYACSLKTIDDDREQMRVKIKELTDQLKDASKVGKKIDQIFDLLNNNQNADKPIVQKSDNALIEMAKICMEFAKSFNGKKGEK